ncbi:hypothetical protein GALMADRAFT_67550 [Galerina marginata CBS 339.88]|uniref:Uncharacterized protein n=1 Tax=Galerina marginata (strain CBS 339.88) TaxID=685588 RepID=A0A067T8R5_GALM3|nr:hypothetical protein GALMADRAFT_67550 [Galerina marginata CBS 339.88]
MHLAKRVDPLGPPSGVAGIDSSVVVVDTTAAAAATGLALDPSAAGISISPPPLDFTNTGIQPTPTPTPTPDDSSSASPTPTALAAASTKSISLTTVIGSCVGAFIGASALIVLGLWIYRRYSHSLKKQARTRGPLILARNTQGDEQRRRSRLEPWNKLEDDDDKWEEMYQTKETKEVDQVAPMEKLTMFKKTPSVRTAYTHKSTDVGAFHFPQSYAEFDPNLAQTLALGKSTMPEPQPFLAKVEVNTDLAWDTEATGDGSYLSVRSQSSNPNLPRDMAIPTPPPTESFAHKWESAEVVHYSDAQSIETVTQFGQEDGESRRSIHNPFFNAQDSKPRSRSNSVTKSPKAKGKERMRYSNTTDVTDPFDDMNELMSMPKPSFVQHAATASSSSTESKERALQSLIAALDMSEDEVRDRLRIASMQPSIISAVSTGTFDEDVTKAFPLPPRRNDENSSHR